MKYGVGEIRVREERCQVLAAVSSYAGGRRGKERAARNERSSDWRRGAAGSPDPNLVLCGGSPREGARSEERAEQRLAAGGRRLPRPRPGTEPGPAPEWFPQTHP